MGCVGEVRGGAARVRDVRSFGDDEGRVELRDRGNTRQKIYFGVVEEFWKNAHSWD